MISCGKRSTTARGRVERRSSVMLKPGLFGARPVIGQIEAFFDQGVESTSRCSPEPWRECSSMFLTIEVGALAVLDHLVEVATQHVGQFGDLVAPLVLELDVRDASAAVRR